MKNIFTSALLFLAVTAFSQDNKKDTAQLYDYGARIYDARIGRSMSTDPKQSKENNPYNYTSTDNTMQNEPYTLTDVDKTIKEKAKSLIEQAIKAKSLSALFDKTTICGPILWNNYLSKGGDKEIKGVDMNFHLSNGKEQQTIIGKAIQTDNGLNKVWNFLLGKSTAYKIRKPSKEELTAYASLLSPNISEPVFVLSINDKNYLLHVDYRNMSLLFIDQL